jgi:hypothetical protein
MSVKLVFQTLLLTFSTQHDTDNYMLPDFPNFKLRAAAAAAAAATTTTAAVGECRLQSRPRTAFLLPHLISGVLLLLSLNKRSFNYIWLAVNVCLFFISSLLTLFHLKSKNSERN